MNSIAATPARKSDAAIVGGFLENPLQVVTGQEEAERGNETSATWFLEIESLANEEIQALEQQIATEENTDSKNKLMTARDELLDLQKSVHDLRENMHLVILSSGDKKPVATLLLASGSTLFSKIKTAVNSSKQKRLEAQLNDIAAYAELERRKREAERERRGVYVLGEDTGNLAAVIALFASVFLGVDVTENEATAADGILNKHFSGIVANLNLSDAERDLVVNSLVAARSADAQEKMEQLRTGKTRGMAILQSEIQRLIQDMMREVPQGMRTEQLAALVPLISLDQKSVNLLTQGETPETFVQLGNFLREQGPQAMEKFQEGLDLYDFALQERLELIAIAKNDIRRALAGAELNTEALSQLLSPGDVAAIAQDIETAKAENPIPPALTLMEQVEAAFTGMMGELEANRKGTGFSPGDFAQKFGKKN